MANSVFLLIIQIDDMATASNKVTLPLLNEDICIQTTIIKTNHNR